MCFLNGFLFSACELGNLPLIKCLVLHLNISVNQVDKKGLFPIYYACKHGHKDIVKFLISIGGADISMNNIIKCYMVSIPSIKDLIKDFICHEQYFPSPFLYRFNECHLAVNESEYDNITSFLIFSNPNEPYQLADIQVHSVILEVRCPKFYKSIRGKQGRSIELYSFNEFRPYHFRLIIKYLYLGTLLIHKRSMIKFFIKICAYLQLDTLKSKLKAFSSNTYFKPLRIFDSFLEFKKDYSDYFILEILNKVINLDKLNILYFCYETESKSLKTINKAFFPYQFSTIDCLLQVEKYLIPCHQLILKSQSLYFKELLTNDFYEGRVNEYCLNYKHLLPIFTINDFPFEVVLDILEYLYTGNCELKEDRLAESLKASDYYLIEELKELAAIKIHLPLCSP